METFLSNGVEIAYVDFEPLTEDRGEPIVLVHGFASTHAVNWLFTQWVKTLTEDGRRVIVLTIAATADPQSSTIRRIIQSRPDGCGHRASARPSVDPARRRHGLFARRTHRHGAGARRRPSACAP